MPIDITMPALSPTMEKGTLARWLVKEGDSVKAGDLLAEIETDKATMEFEAIDDGVISRIAIPEGSEDVAVGTVIAVIVAIDEADVAAPSPARTAAAKTRSGSRRRDSCVTVSRSSSVSGEPVKASPLARRLAAANGIDLASITGTGPDGRVVRADLAIARPASQPTPAPASPVPATSVPTPTITSDIPHELVKLSGMRKTIARRLTESKQQIPHIYLTVDIRLDALLALRGRLNATLAARGIKLSVNDLLIKALALSLIEVPECNVSFAGDTMLRFSRADISVAVSIPNGLITPVIVDAGSKSLSAIANEMKTLAGRARDGKLQPHEYQGGTASLSNMGMYGIRQFEAVVNPPQAMILAIGAGEARPFVSDGELGVATVMSATGSFDHRAIDGADGARLMQAFKGSVEKPMSIIV